MKKIEKLILLNLLLLPLCSLADIIHIPDDYPTIQQGIDASNDHDTVLIDPGEYFENLTLDNRDIILGSLFLASGDTGFISQTIINGSGIGRGMAISNVTPPCRISGLTYTNGFSQSGGGVFISSSNVSIDHIRVISNLSSCGTGGYVNGGGIAIYNSWAFLDDFVIQSNEAYCTTPPVNPEGGGIYAIGSAVHLQKGKISANQAYLGGGLYLNNCSASVRFIEFDQNFAPYPGGAICSFDSGMEIEGCVFSENDAAGSVIYSEDINPVSITNSLFINNSGSVIHAGNLLRVINSTFTGNDEASCILCFQNTTLYMMNSILWNDNAYEIEFSNANNTAYLGYNDIQGGITGIYGSANITFFGSVYNFVPGFTNDSTFNLSDSSLCLGAGLDTLVSFPYLASPKNDINDSLRPNPPGSMPDLGAYESILANPTTGLDEFSSDLKVKVYPNPAGELLFIESTDEIQKLSLYNSTGSIMFTKEAEPGKMQLDVRDLPSGIYMLQAIINNQPITRKVVVMH